jgi:hypothetical protein
MGKLFQVRWPLCGVSSIKLYGAATPGTGNYQDSLPVSCGNPALLWVKANNYSS